MTRSAQWSASRLFASRWLGLLGRSVFLLIALVGLLGLPAAALADDEEEELSPEEQREERIADLKRKGPFVGVGGLATFANSGPLHNGVSLDGDTGAGFNVRAGLRTAPWFAFEVMYEQWLKMDVSGQGQKDDAKGWFWSLNGKGYLFTETPFQPYALVGVGAMSIQPRIISRRTGFGMRFAGGLDYNMTKHWILNVEAGYALGIGTQVEDLGYGMAGGGVTYRF